MNRDDAYFNSRQAWEAAREARAHSPLAGVLERMGAVVAWEDAPKDWSDYGRRLEEIRERYGDPYLKLAVIGDFSCGKSTFLNAVLGMDLLKTDLMATTAVPTMLRWDGAPGSGVRVTGVRPDGFEMDATGAHRDAFAYYVNKTLPEEAGALIDAVTTDNNLIRRLKRVEVGLPAQEGRYGLCLVDTPGVNPGAGDTKEHVAVTRKVLRQSADSAIVLFPAQSVFTASLQDFLLENAEHFLNNAIFIVTKADAARDDDEVEQLREFVCDVLEEIGVQSPTVYCMAARDALRFDLGKPQEESDALWSRRFHEDIDAIFGDLNRRREAIAAESTGGMLDAMIRPLRADLNAMRQALRERHDALERWSPAAMRKECEALLRQYRQDSVAGFGDRLLEVATGVNGVFDARMARVENRIREKNTATALNWYLGHGLKDDLSDLSEPIQGVLNEAGKTQREAYDAFAGRMVDCLNRYRINIAGSAAARYVEDERHELAVDVKVNGEMGKNPTILSTVFDTLGGAGEILGDLFTLDIGEAFSDLFDTVINLLAGVFSLFMSMKHRQDDAVKAVSEQLGPMKGRVKAQCREALQAQRDTLTEAASRLLERLEADYRHIFDRKKKEYEEEMLGIRASIAECEYQLNELEACDAIVRDEREGSPDALRGQAVSVLNRYLEEKKRQEAQRGDPAGFAAGAARRDAPGSALTRGRRETC